MRDHGRPDGADDPAHVQRIHRLREERKLDEILHRRSGNAKHARFENWRDKWTASRALDSLFREARGRGVTTERIKAESKVRIHQLVKAKDTEAPDRASVEKMRLPSILSPYLNAAKAIAPLIEIDAKEAQFRILRDTALWQTQKRDHKSGVVPDVVGEQAEQLKFLLHELCARAIRDGGLADLFARMRRVPGQWDIRTERFMPGKMGTLFRTAYSEWNEYWEEAPPLPSVPLIHIRQKEWELRVRRSNMGGNELPECPFGPSVSDEEGIEVNAEVRLDREIRLALGPTVNADAIGPLFESRAYATLAILDENGGVDSSGPLDPSCDLSRFDPGSSVHVRLDDTWRRVTPVAAIAEPGPDQWAAAISGRHVDSLLYWDHTPLGEQKGCFEHHDVSWTPVDARHVEHWLGRWEHADQAVCALPNAAGAGNKSESWYPRPYLAHLVEEAIYDGRLEAALRKEIEHVKTAFQAREAEWRARTREQTDAEVARFRSDLLSGDVQQ
jgi:hypothetical protein